VFRCNIAFQFFKNSAHYVWLDGKYYDIRVGCYLFIILCCFYPGFIFKGLTTFFVNIADDNVIYSTQLRLEDPFHQGLAHLPATDKSYFFFKHFCLTKKW